MNDLTFDKLPQAVILLFDKLSNIEKMLLENQNNSQSNNDELLTIQEAGAYLNLSVPTMYGLTQRAEVPFMKKSKRLYFSKSQLLEWLHTGKRKTLAETSKEASQYLNKKKGGFNA
jgi:excisionase family DNA binding protein